VITFFAHSGLIDAAIGAALIITVFAALYHAEIVAHRTRKPFDALILAVAATIIEVSLIIRDDWRGNR
jgi:Ca2+:H+ antiporter